ncbi:MAG: AAA family ATPase [Rhodospirillaceae bacterium]|nr:AAA family ATPase [Rhodospirillaceae bacterium]MBT5459752.1 AAA family ATPase [Rhodospirillaceae bacterium]
MPIPEALAPDQLYTACNPDDLALPETGGDIDLSDSLGQHRAVEAIQFGVGIKRDGYNIFAHGAPGTGKHTLVRRHIEEAAAAMPAPQDWCYVHNFQEQHKPKALNLPAGRGCALSTDMEKLIEELRSAIPAAFESEDYQARLQALQTQFSERHEAAFNELQERASEKNVALIRTPAGLALAPTSKGEVVNPEAFRQWPDEMQEKIREDIAELEKELQEILQKLPQWEKAQREELRSLNQEVTSRAVGHLIEALTKKYDDLPDVLEYIEQVRRDLQENSEEFQINEPQSPQEMMAVAMSSGPRKPSFRRYQVNVIVDNGKTNGAPIVYEDLPTHANVMGRIEQMAQFGALMTDFNLIKPGALHAANGGFLLIDARKIFMQPIIWEEIKRALFSREIRIQGLTEALGFANTVTLQPEPIPLDVKIVLMGDPSIYYMLSQLDPEFDDLFKVAADFEDQVPRNDGNTAHYAQLISSIAQRENLRPLDASAMARVIERAARLAADSERLTLRMRSISDLLCEAEFWADKNGTGKITADDVEHAIDAQIHRADRIRERSQEQILRETMLIDTEGEVVGQVNGLSVLQLGNFAFGKPSRITAQVRLGRGEVLDIEREIELGGPLHSKGVLILSGFLGARFARRHPLALSASLVFEQSYGGVDGDSASSTELYALLSALSELPIRQSLAVTGSVNQHGRVQAIGGANEKIEGFFDICAARGLTGDQGVLIPASNVKHLMLRQDVVDAARDGKFHIYPVETIDQGIELLTGVAAGEADDGGIFPPDTVNGRVQATLAAFAEQARAFTTGGLSGGERNP